MWHRRPSEGVPWVLQEEVRGMARKLGDPENGKHPEEEKGVRVNLPPGIWIKIRQAPWCCLPVSERLWHSVFCLKEQD